MIEKRHVVLAALVLALGTAVYINWRFSEPPSVQIDTSASQGNLGDIQYVNGSQLPSSNPTQSDQETTSDFTESMTESAQRYFSEAELSRQKARDEAIEVLESIIKSDQADKDSKQSATEQLAEIAKNIEKESKIESLLKAKGFSKTLAFLENETANILVAGDGLLTNQTVTIKDIVKNITSFPFEKIIIVEVK